MVPVRSSYRAAQAVSPDKLELTEKPLFDPPVMATIPIRVPGCGFMPPGRITRLGGSRDGAPRELGFP